MIFLKKYFRFCLPLFHISGTGWIVRYNRFCQIHTYIHIYITVHTCTNNALFNAFTWRWRVWDKVYVLGWQRYCSIAAANKLRYVCMYVCMYTWMDIFDMYACMYVCMYVLCRISLMYWCRPCNKPCATLPRRYNLKSLCMYVCMYVCITAYVCMYVCMCVRCVSRRRDLFWRSSSWLANEPSKR